VNIEEARAFLYREARLLDERRFADWLEILTEDISYRVPLTDYHEDDAYSREISITDDNRRRLESRVWHVGESGLNHTQDPPARTLRTISNVELSMLAENEAEIWCAVVIHEYRANAQRRFEPAVHPARGRYLLRRDEGKPWRIAIKEISLLARDGYVGALTFLV
jgi:3-phenylpropionate/cinnamic acid dioxygenase small subunit